MKDLFIFLGEKIYTLKLQKENNDLLLSSLYIHTESFCPPYDPRKVR